MSQKRRRIHTDAVTAAFVEQDRALEASRSKRPAAAQSMLCAIVVFQGASIASIAASY